VKKSLWKSSLTCYKLDYGMSEFVWNKAQFNRPTLKYVPIRYFLTVLHCLEVHIFERLNGGGAGGGGELELDRSGSE
jgi:hypothetical protein